MCVCRAPSFVSFERLRGCRRDNTKKTCCGKNRNRDKRACEAGDERLDVRVRLLCQKVALQPFNKNQLASHQRTLGQPGARGEREEALGSSAV